MNDLLTPAALLAETVKLTLFDRCDSPGVKHILESKHRENHPSCQERAYVLVQLPSGLTLTFCKHHYERNEAILLASGAVVVDDTRSDLEVKPGVSAAS